MCFFYTSCFFSLVRPTVVFHMLIDMSCLQPHPIDVEVVFELCLPCTHLSHSDTMLYALLCKRYRSHSTIHHKCHTCRSHFQSVMLSICCLDDLRSLVLKSCWVCVHNIRICTNSLTHTLIHFSEVLTTGSPSNSHTSTLQSTQPIVTQNNVEVSKNPFQSTLTISWSSKPSTGQLESFTGQWPWDSLPSLPRWLRKLCRQDG